MPVTLTFYTMSEKTPEHGQAIIYLRKGYSFDMPYFEPQECEVEYQWLEVDEEGDQTGNAVIYTPGDEPLEGHTLTILFDGWEAEKGDYYWIPIEEYYKAFGEEETND